MYFYYDVVIKLHFITTLPYYLLLYQIATIVITSLQLTQSSVTTNVHQRQEGITVQ